MRPTTPPHLASRASEASSPHRVGRSAGMALIALAALGLLVGGCSTQNKLVELNTVAEFDQTVLQSNRPVLVDFYKDSCPTCVIQEAALEPLVDEYVGRVAFTRFKIRESTMKGSSPEIMDRYNLFWVPTVILFVNGQEAKRWVFNHPTEEFRAALNEVLSGAAPTAATAGVPFSKSLTAGWETDASQQCVEGQGCRLDRVP